MYLDWVLVSVLREKEEYFARSSEYGFVASDSWERRKLARRIANCRATSHRPYR